MTTSVAIVDERDLDFAGTWTDGGTPEEFQNTTRWSAVQGSTASFSFVGTSVTVFGTIVDIHPPQATLTFLIDNSITGMYTPPDDLPENTHHQTLWSSPQLEDGAHRLVITQTAAQSVGIVFLDYIMWNTTSVEVPAYFIDDRDTRVKYTPSWQQFQSDHDFMHTSQGTTNVGDSLSVQFDGIAISHYGDINEGSAGDVLNASFSIDGGPSVSFVPPPQASGVTNNNLYYSSGDLNPGTHTLVVTAENAHTVWADYWLVKPNPASFTSTAAPRSSSSPPPTTTPLAPKPKHTAAIAGSVVAGVVLLFLLLGAGFVRRRHGRKIQRQRQRESFDMPMAQAALQVTPFPSPGTDEATTPNFVGSGSPFSDPIAAGATTGGSASREWTGPSGAAPPAHFAGESAESAADESSAFATAGSSSGNPLSSPPRTLTLASASGMLPSGKMARYEAPPTRAAAASDGDQGPPGYDEE